MTANWCWNSFNRNLEQYSFKIHQNSSFFGGVYISSAGSPFIDTRSGGIGTTTASETFHAEWICIVKDCQPFTIDTHYWVHVVGGATNLDFAVISTNVGG
ncbi:MAG: hypothetical protein ACJ75L_06625 [Gaiellaceae bacterium]